MRVLCSCDIYRYECRYVGNKLPVSALAGTVVLDIISKYHYFVRGMDISAFDMLYQVYRFAFVSSSGVEATGANPGEYSTVFDKISKYA